MCASWFWLCEPHIPVLQRDSAGHLSPATLPCLSQDAGVSGSLWWLSVKNCGLSTSSFPSPRSLHKETACFKRGHETRGMKNPLKLAAHGWSLWQSFRDQKRQFSNVVKHGHVPVGRSRHQTHLLLCPLLVQ